MKHDWNKEFFKLCPHCHGKMGFELVKIVRHIETVSWNGEVISVDGDSIRVGKKLRCMECGKAVGNATDFKYR